MNFTQHMVVERVVISSGKIAGNEGGSGGLKIASSQVFTLIGNVNYDSIAVMQYPSKDAFTAFAMSQSGSSNRQALRGSKSAKRAGDERKILRSAGLSVQALIAIHPDNGGTEILLPLSIAKYEIPFHPLTCDSGFLLSNVCDQIARIRKRQ